MHINNARSILANNNPLLGLVWNDSMKLWGLVLGYHMEYITPEDLADMDEPLLMVAVHNRMQRYMNSLSGNPDVFYMN